MSCIRGSKNARPKLVNPIFNSVTNGLVGQIYNDPRFKDGTVVSTTQIKGVQTRNTFYDIEYKEVTNHCGCDSDKE